MSGFRPQVKETRKELNKLKQLVKKGVKFVGKICKKGWRTVKRIRR